MEGDARHAGLLHQAPGEVDAVAVAGALAGRSFTVTGRPDALARRLGDGHGPVRLGEQRRPAPVLHTLRTGQPMLRSIRSAPASAAMAAAARITSASWPNSCSDTGCSSGWMLRNSSTVRLLP